MKLVSIIKEHELVSIATAKRHVKSMPELGIIEYIDKSDTKKGFIGYSLKSRSL